MQRTLFSALVLGFCLVEAWHFTALSATAADATPAKQADGLSQSNRSAQNGDVKQDGQTANLQQLAQLAVSHNEKVARRAIADLRAAGPAGLQALVQVNQTAIDEHLKAGPNSNIESDKNWPQLKAALDTVGGQYDDYTSRLYWYTDLDAVRAAAKQTGKPILSLRLLGKLTDEFSCANSRFFRTTLYANETVNRALRERFVLHWQTVRPVPVVTVDFGDGRKLERTLTGNSIHYVLDCDGRPIDAMPGLYGPAAFLRGLDAAEAAAVAVHAMNDSERASYLRKCHKTKANQIVAQWQNDLEKLNIAKSDAQASSDTEDSSKTVNNLLALTDENAWAQIAQLHAIDAQLDAASIALIRAQNPSAAKAMPLAATKAIVETPLLRLVRTFQNTVSIDTVRNEYMFHRQIHEWFASGQTPIDINVNDLNEMVYAQLFLTPSDDPWLGLLPGDAYTALDNNGVCQK